MKFISTSGKKIENEFVAFSAAIAEDGSFYIPENLQSISQEEFINLSTLDSAKRFTKIFSYFFEDIDLITIENELTKYFSEHPCFKLQKLNSYSNEQLLFEAWHNEVGNCYDFVFFAYKLLLEALKKKYKINNELIYVLFCPGQLSLPAINKFKDDKLILLSRTKYIEGIHKYLINQYDTKDNLLHIKSNLSIDDLNQFELDMFSSDTLRQKLADSKKNLICLNGHSLGCILIYTAIYIFIYTELLKLFKENKNEEDKLNEEEINFDFAYAENNLDFALASCYAKAMGVSLRKFYLINNQNRTSSELIKTAKFNACHRLTNNLLIYLDSLIPANLERFIFELSFRDQDVIEDMKRQMNKSKRFDLSPKILSTLKKYFVASFIKDSDLINNVREIYDNFDQFLDPQTATAVKACQDIRNRYDKNKHCMIYFSCLSAQSFPIFSLKCLSNKKSNDKSFIDCMNEIEKETAIPKVKFFEEKINDFRNNNLHVIIKENILRTIEEFIF